MSYIRWDMGMPDMRTCLGLLTGLLGLGLAGVAPAAAQSRPEVTVFAAASLTNALQEIADAFGTQSGARVKLSFAASSALAKQIEAGAKVQIFVSADEAWMDHVEKIGLVAPGTRRALAGNRLVLVVPATAAIALDPAAAGWLARLPPGRIATADPAHVPVGRYARQALTRLGAWGEAEGRLARAENVRSALVLVERGEAVAGIVYATDAAASKQVTVAATFPETAHDAIVYPMALLRGEEQGVARKLYDFLTSGDAKAVLHKHGFSTR